MRHVALDGFHQVWDQVMPPRELHVDIGPPALHGIPHPDQAVVGLEQQKQQYRGDNRNGYKRVRNIQGRSSSRASSKRRCKMESILRYRRKRTNRRRFTLITAD
jgi:hypothetical protein